MSDKEQLVQTAYGPVTAAEQYWLEWLPDSGAEADTIKRTFSTPAALAAGLAGLFVEDLSEEDQLRAWRQLDGKTLQWWTRDLAPASHTCWELPNGMVYFGWAGEPVDELRRFNETAYAVFMGTIPPMPLKFAAGGPRPTRKDFWKEVEDFVRIKAESEGQAVPPMHELELTKADFDLNVDIRETCYRRLLRLAETGVGKYTYDELRDKGIATRHALLKAADAKGHDTCWYNPEVLVALMRLWDVVPLSSADRRLPPRHEFEAGCRAYADELYDSASEG